MTLAVLALVVSTQSAKTVTVTTDFGPATEVLRQVGAAAGLDMRPTGSVRSDCSFVRFTATPVETAMTRIAKTLNATWEKQQDGTYLLSRSAAQERMRPSASIVNRDSITRLLSGFTDKELTASDYTKGLAPGAGQVGPGEANWPVIDWYRDNGPDSRLIIRLLKSIGADALSQLPEGQTVWFVARPNRRQRPFPAAIDAALGAFARESAAYLQAEQALPQQATLKTFLTAPKSMANATRLALSVERTGNGLQSQLYVESGPELASHEKFMQEGKGEPLEVEPNALTRLTASYVVSDSAAPLVRVAQRSVRGDVAGEPAGDAKVWLGAVTDKRDFTSVFATDFLTQTSLALNRDVVAYLPDFAALIPVFGVQRADMNMMLGQLWVTSPNGADSVVVSDQEGYVSIAPANPVRARERFPRQELARLSRAVAENRVDVELVADLVAKTETDGAAITSLLMAGLSAPDGKAGARSVLYSGLDLWRLYGRLSPEQRAAARKDGYAISLQNPPPAIKGIIEYLVYGKNMDVAPPDTKGLPSSKPGLDRFSAFSLGDGFPAGSRLTVRLKRNPTLFVRRSSNDRAGAYPVTLDVAARILAMAGSPVGLADPNQYGVSGFAVGAEAELKLEFSLPGLGFNTLGTTVPELEKGARLVPADQLPSPWKERLAEQTAKVKEQLKNLRPGTTNPPPP